MESPGFNVNVISYFPRLVVAFNHKRSIEERSLGDEHQTAIATIHPVYRFVVVVIVVPFHCLEILKEQNLEHPAIS